jgi:hypothetical protein
MRSRYWRKIEGALVNAGGRPAPQYSVDQQTGQMVQAANQAAPGQLFKNMLVGALSGISSAAHNPRGGFLGAVGNGFMGGMQQQQQQQQQARGNAQQQFQMQQQASDEHAQTAASIAHLNAATYAAQLQNQKLDDDRMQEVYKRGQALVDANKDNLMYENQTWQQLQDLQKSDPSIGHRVVFQPVGTKIVTDASGKPVIGPDGQAQTEEIYSGFSIPQDHTLSDSEVKQYVKDGFLPDKTYKAGTVIPGAQYAALVNRATQKEHTDLQQDQGRYQ